MTHDLLQDLRFENCVIVGPAIIALLSDVAVVNCSFDAPNAEAVLWRVDRARGSQGVMGVIGARRIGFYSCKFERVGFAVGEDTYDSIRAEMDGW